MIGNQVLLGTLAELLRKKNSIPEIKNSESLYNFFNYINLHKENFNNSFLLNYLYKNISSELIAKRKTSARDFEDYLGIVLGGIITDETIRTNKSYSDVFVENDFVTSFVKSNKREKIDILFQEGYGLSIKTLMYTNKEINCGSFEKKALFYDFGIDDYLDERKGRKGIGLGSKPQLKKLLQMIEDNGEYEKFRLRFIEMLKHIFSDDVLIAIKNNTQMDLYIVRGEDFSSLIEKESYSIDTLLTVINRWEGNSIRMDRTKILEIGQHIHLDFSFLSTSIVQKIEATEQKILKYIIYYINDHQEREKYKDLIFEECNEILRDIDKNIKELN